MRMRRQSKIIYLFLGILFFCVADSFAYKKHALLVGISDYENNKAVKQDNRFNNINGKTDVNLMAPVLQKQGFQVKKLVNREATHNAIITNLKSLASKCSAGDIVYIHFSTHGQLVEDLNGDEADGWDEAIIPYDAQKMYRKGVYEGQNHLLDDELSIYVDKIRKRLGETGMLYVVIDACHAGTSSRGKPLFFDIAGLNDSEEEKDIPSPEPAVGPSRFSGVVFSKNSKIYKRSNNKVHKDFIQLRKEVGKSPVVFMEACRSDELSHEVEYAKDKNCGPLTYHIHKVLQNTNITKNDGWIQTVKKNFDSDIIIQKRRAALRQHMVIEKAK